MRTFPDRALRKNAHFTQLPSASVQIVEQATDQYTNDYHIRGKLKKSALGNPSQECTFIDDSVFEHIYLHLTLSCLLLPKEVTSLNACHTCFCRFHHMLRHMNLDVVCKLFQHDTNCASQKIMLTERRLQFLFLSAIHRLHVPSIVRSFPGNYTASHGDPEKIFKA